MTAVDGANSEAIQVGVNVLVEPYSDVKEHTTDLVSGLATAIVEQGVYIPQARVDVSKFQQFHNSIGSVEQQVIDAQNHDPYEHVQAVVDAGAKTSFQELESMEQEHRKLLSRALLKHRVIGLVLGASSFAFGSQAAKDAVHHRSPVGGALLGAACISLGLGFESESVQKKSKKIMTDIRSKAQEFGVIRLVQNSLPKPEVKEKAE